MFLATNEVVVTNRGVREVERKEEEEATSTTRIPDKETSSSKKVDKVSSREKALRELSHFIVQMWLRLK